MSKISFIIAAFLVFLTSCATVNKPDIKDLGINPNISKSIEGESSTKIGLKRKVAIARFSNETKYGQGFFIDKKNDRIGKQALDILSSKLFETDRFIVIERADLESINKELGIGSLHKLGNMADYLIVGSVTEFGRKDTGEAGLFTRTRKQEAVAKVHVRLIDVYTGQIVYAEEGSGSAFSETGNVFGYGNRAGYDSSINDQALDAAITSLTSNIVENLLNKPWRSYILTSNQGSLIISGGKSQNVKAGDLFDVVKIGKRINNPQTNTVITLPGKVIAKLEVIQTLGNNAEDEVSMCKLISGDLSKFIGKNDFTQLLVQE